MYAEPFSSLGPLSNLEWAGATLAYAIFYLIFNGGFCAVLGGICGFKSYWSIQKATNKRNRWFRMNIPVAWMNVRQGANEYLDLFKADPIVWVWPFTVLALPILFYQVSNNTISGAVQQLELAGFPLMNYRLPFFIRWQEAIPWLALAFILFEQVSEFLRYHRRPEKLWFSRNVVLRVSTMLLFNVVIAYSVINLSLKWIDYGSALYRMLADPQTGFNIFSSDLMYGLKPAYNTILLITVFLVLISILPAVILFREKKQKYTWIYYALLYSGLITIFLVNGALILQFNHCLDQAHSFSMQNILATYHISADSIIAQPANALLLNGLGLIRYLNDLPGSFPVPGWLTSLVGLRSILLIYELSVVFAPKNEMISLSEAFRRVLKRMAD